MAFSQTTNGLRVLSKAVGVVPVVGDSISKAVDLIVMLGNMLEMAHDNATKMSELVKEAALLLEAILLQLAKSQSLPQLSLKEKMDHVKDLTIILKEILQLAEEKEQTLIERVWNRNDDTEAIEKWKQRLRIVKDSFIITSQLRVLDRADQILHAVTTQQPPPFAQLVYPGLRDDLRIHLNPVIEARHTIDSSMTTKSRTGCLENTRIDVLRRIHHWAEDGDTNSIYWLVGLAGSGKSTIAQTICDQLSNAQPRRLGASFFFSRDEELRRNPENVVRTLAYQLAQFSQMKQLILNALEQQHDVMWSTMREQMLILIGHTLAQADNLPSPFVIVLDALDECDRYGGDLVPLLSYTLRLLPRNLRVKILITSRPIREVQIQFEDVAHTSFHLHKVDPAVVDAEIRLYLAYHLRRIASAYANIDPSAWPSEADLMALVQRSGGLYIFAATVVGYVNTKPSPIDRLRALLATPVANSTGERYKQVDDIYLQVLDTAKREGGNDAEWFKYLKRVAGAVALLQNPLPEEAFVQLLNEKLDATQSALHSLSAVVLIPEPPVKSTEVVRVFHPSFPNFITDPKRCNERFLIQKPAHYAMLARRCLEILSEERNLRVDKCRIRYSSLLNSEVPGLSLRVQQEIPPEVAFACKFWLDSLIRATPGDRSVMASLDTFCKKRIFHWIEACSLIGALTHVLNCLHHIQNFFEGQADFEGSYTILQNTERVLLSFFTPISKSALQTYYSTLPLVPSCPLLDLAREHLDQFNLPVPRLLTSRPESWSPALMALEGHSAQIACLAVSSDGERLAGGSIGGSVCVWSPWSGQVISRLQNSSEIDCIDIAFTPNMKQIWVSQGRSVHIWNAITATHIRELTPNVDEVHSLAISPEGSRCIFGSRDGSISLWDVHSAEYIKSFCSEGKWVRKVLYSNNGSRIFTGHRGAVSKEGAIYIWDALSGERIGELKEQSTDIEDLALTGDDRLLISANYDPTVRVWDVELRKQVRLLEGHKARVRRVAVSDHNRNIISGDVDGVIRIWSIDTSACLRTSRHSGDQSYITDLVSFPNSARFCSTAASHEAALIWSTQASPPTEQPASKSQTRRLKTRMRDVYQEAKSVLKVGTKDNATVDMHNGAGVSASALSPDGSFCAVGFKDGSIKLTNTRSAGTPQELVPDPTLQRLITSLSFSKDGNWLVSTCHGEVTQIWDVNSRKEIVAFKKTSQATLFPNKASISVTVSRSPVGIIHILSIKEGVQLQRLVDAEQPRVLIASMQVSPNNLFLLSVNYRGRCCVWNVTNGSQLASFSYPVNALLTFTPDSRRIVSYGLSGFVSVWNAMGAEHEAEPPKFEGEDADALFHITRDGWVCGPTSPFGAFNRIVWLPPNCRTLLYFLSLPAGRRQACWFHRGVLTTISSNGRDLIRLDVSDLLEHLGDGGRE